MWAEASRSASAERSSEARSGPAPFSNPATTAASPPPPSRVFGMNARRAPSVLQRSLPSHSEQSMKRSFAASAPRAVAVLVAVATLALGFAARAAEPKRVLLVTVTKDFRHSSIPTAMAVIGELAEKSHAFTVDFVFNDQDMATKMT